MQRNRHGLDAHEVLVSEARRGRPGELGGHSGALAQQARDVDPDGPAVLAHRRPAAQAAFASAAGVVRLDDHALADPIPAYALPDRHDRADPLVAGDPGEATGRSPDHTARSDPQIPTPVSPTTTLPGLALALASHPSW